MKKITKAVIPVAGLGTRFLPFTKAMPKEMLPLVDKPTIQYIVEEAVKSGITDILFITAAHSNKRAIEDHFDHSGSLENILREKKKFDLLEEVNEISEIANLYYIRQKEPKGLGHAILSAKSFVGNEPFAVLLGDDVVISKRPALLDLIDSFYKYDKSIMGTQPVNHDQVNKYGIVVKESGESDKMVDFVEKPSIGSIDSNLAVLGRYILTPNIFEFLETQEADNSKEIQLTDAVKRMMEFDDVYACEFSGNRYDIGDKLGFLKATVDIALEREELKEDFLSYIKEK